MSALVQWVGALFGGTADPVSQQLFYLFLTLLAAAECVGGWQMLRPQLGVCAALVGGAFGYAFGWRILRIPLSFPQVLLTLLIAASLAALCVVAVLRLYRLGILCVVFTVVCCAVLLFFDSLAAGIVAGLLLGTLAALLLRPAVMLVTATGGGAVMANALCAAVGAPPWVQYAATALFAVLGVFLQWLALPRRSKQEPPAAQETAQATPSTKAPHTPSKPAARQTATPKAHAAVPKTRNNTATQRTQRPAAVSKSRTDRSVKPK